MSSILTDLHDNSIITSTAVMRLKSYIAGKNPDVSVARRAVILADAMNKVIDSRLPKFEEMAYRKMKRSLLEHTANKPSFDIYCSDVFRAAIELKESGEHFFEELDIWLAVNLGRNVSRKQLVSVVLETHELMSLRPEMDITDMIAEAEATVRTRSDLLAGAAVEKAAISVPEPVPGIDEAMEPYAVLGHFSGIFSEKRRSKSFVLNRLTGDWRRSYALAAATVMLAVVTFFWVGKITDGTSFGSDYPEEAVKESNLAYAMTVLTNEDIAAGSNSTANERKMRMKATAYDLSAESCGKLPGEPGYGITSSGRKAEEGRTVAVDPEVIPLGSRLRITFPEEYSHLDGIYVAEDTGRLIKGSSIDIFFGEDNKGSTAINEKAMKFGVRFVDVTILNNSEKKADREVQQLLQ